MKLFLRLVLPFTALLFSLHGFGQSWLWAKQPVFTGHPTNQSDGEAWAVATDNVGNVYEAGFFAYATMQYNTFFLNSVNPTAFLAKYDANGNPLWATQGVLKTLYDESVANAVAVDNAGNVYITGFFMDSVTFGNIILTSNPGQQQGDFLEVFLVKYNSNGVVQWAKQSTTTKFNSYPNQGLGLTCDHTGNIYITGQFGNTMTFGTASVSTPSGGAGDVFLVKYDTNGNVLWAEGGQLPSSASTAKGNAITVDANNNIYITGSFHDTVSFGAQMLVNRSVVGDIFVARFANDGTPLWAKQTTNRSTDFWENGPISGNGLTTDRAGNVYLAGNFEDTIYFDSVQLISPIPFAQYAFPYGDMLITKYDPNGNVVWAEAGEPFVNGSYAGWSIACDSLNHLYYLGTGANFANGGQLNYVLKFGADTFSTGNTPLSWEGSFVIEFDTFGNVLCGSGMPMGGDEQGGITTDPSGKYVYLVQDDNALNTVYIGGDTINYPAVTGEEIPFTARWSPCTKISLVANINHTNVTCNGLCNGQATVSVQGGVLPYKYLWNTPHSDTTKTITGLCARAYTVIVTDSIGTTASALVTISQPQVFKVSASPDTSVCGGDTVILNAAVTGGAGPYSYAWSPSTGLNDTTQAQVLASPADSTTYRVIATTSANCTASATVSININAALAGLISADKDTICGGSTARLTITGNSAALVWQSSTGNNFTNIPGADSSVYSATPQQTTNYRVIAGTGSCSDTSAVFALIVNAVPSPPNIVAADSIICSGDSTQVCAEGVFSSYIWNTGVSSSCIEVNSAGGYWVTATGANDCAVVSNHADIAVYPVSSVSIVVQNDTLSSYGAVTYQWYLNDSAIAGATSPLLIAQAAGSYTVQISDTNGCEAVSNPVTITGITNLEGDRVRIYPNPSTGSWQLVTGSQWTGSQLTVYAVDGKIVLSSVIRNTTSNISFEAMSGVYLLELCSPSACFTYKLIRL